jgi:hypothetical protein
MNGTHSSRVIHQIAQLQALDVECLQVMKNGCRNIALAHPRRTMNDNSRTIYAQSFHR